MFIIRTALVLGAAVLLLPTDEKQQAKLYGTATHAVERIGGFCGRNPETCKQGGELWAVFAKKAEFGGRLVLDLISDRGRSAAQMQPVATQAAANAPSQTGTLRPTDLEPRWRGTPTRSGS